MNSTLPFVRRAPSRLRWLAPFFIAALVVGCSQREEPEVSLSWLAPQTRPALPASCKMPILKQLPNTDYQQIAIIEVVDDYNADDAEVEGLALRKACETGADALVIFENQKQKGRGGFDSNQKIGHTEQNAPDIGEAGHQGRVLNAVAITYKTGSSKTPRAQRKD